MGGRCGTQPQGLATHRRRRHDLPLAPAGPADVRPGPLCEAVHVRSAARRRTGHDPRRHHEPASRQQLVRGAQCCCSTKARRRCYHVGSLPGLVPHAVGIAVPPEPIRRLRPRPQLCLRLIRSVLPLKPST